MRTRETLLTGFLLLSTGVLVDAASSSAGSAQPCQSRESDSLRSLLSYFTQNGIHLTCVERHGGQVVEWIVVQPDIQGVEVNTGFRLFSANESPKRIHEHMARFNRGSVVNESARIAMFLPGGRCTTAEPDCKAAFEESRALQQKLIDLFKRYVPAIQQQAP